MKTVWNWIQVALAAIGGGLGWFFGEMDGFFYALIAFVVIDYLTGVMCAIIDKTLSSNVGFKGIFRKVLSLKYTEETLTLTVADNGVGLTPEKLQELEGKPHYMESTDERLDLRHGLGLLLVRQIVEAHHGTLFIESEPNKGYEARIVFGK